MSNKKRFWEIDFLRGLAIFGVVIFHFLMDLNFFFETSFSLFTGFCRVVQQFGSSLFLFLVGVSLSISNVQVNAPFIKYVRRACKLGAICCVMTVSTFVASPACYIKFGVLHLICLSVILSYLVRNLRYWNLVLGLFVFVIGYKVRQLVAPNDYYFVFGYTTKNFISADYFPIFPYIGVVLFGLGLAPCLYKNGERQFNFIAKPKSIILQGVCFCGRNSLIIYLVHQIVLCVVLFCIAKVFYVGFKLSL